MGDAVLLIVALLLPTALGVVALGAARAVRWWTEWRCWPVPPEPIEQLCATVRRLHAQLEEVENQPAASPGKALRVRALRAAYLDALRTACGRLDVPAPAGNPVRQAEIYRVEADLRRHGLDVRPAVP
ncbi:MAG TPA: hypothetical protein VGJ59_23365 [Jatrophihabitantaceae bacterium]